MGLIVDKDIVYSDGLIVDKDWLASVSASPLACRAAPFHFRCGRAPKGLLCRKWRTWSAVRRGGCRKVSSGALIKAVAVDGVGHHIEAADRSLDILSDLSDGRPKAF